MRVQPHAETDGVSRNPDSYHVREVSFYFERLVVPIGFKLRNREV